MTDQYDTQAAADLTKAMEIVATIYGTKAEAELIDAIAQALADARRAVWGEAYAAGRAVGLREAYSKGQEFRREFGKYEMEWSHLMAWLRQQAAQEEGSDE